MADEATGPYGLSNEEYNRRVNEAGIHGPAVFANNYALSVAPNGMRISFVEGFHGGRFDFRTAVFLSHQDALILAAFIQETLVPEPQTTGGEDGTKGE